MEKLGFIYITTNLINNKKYIGQSTKNCNKEYFGSGLHLIRAVKKYGKQNFNREIISWHSNKNDLDFAEKMLIEKYDACNSEEFYNIASGGQGGNLGPIVCEKLSKSLSGAKNPMYGKKYTEEEIEKLKERARRGEKHHYYGKKRSEEDKKTISDGTKIAMQDPVLREHISNAVKEAWAKFSEEKKQKLSNKKKESMHKFYDTPEGIQLKQSISEKMSGSNNHMYGIPPKVKGGKWMNNGIECGIYHDVEEKLSQGWVLGRIKNVK